MAKPKIISGNLRKKVEQYVIKAFSIIDKTGTNSDYYKKKFAEMTDTQFTKMLSSQFPFRYYETPFKDPSMSDVKEALDFIKVPLYERVSLPYLYEDKDGRPVQTVSDQLVIYYNVKKMQQFLTHKNSMSTDIDKRNMKGSLIGSDKNGGSTDRELQSLAVLNLNNCIDEFKDARADALQSKDKMLNTISNQGYVSVRDIKTDPRDSLSKNMMDTYFIGANIKTNIISEDYTLPHTLDEIDSRKKELERI